MWRTTWLASEAGQPDLLRQGAEYPGIRIPWFVVQMCLCCSWRSCLCDDGVPPLVTCADDGLMPSDGQRGTWWAVGRSMSADDGWSASTVAVVLAHESLCRTGPSCDGLGSPAQQ